MSQVIVVNSNLKIANNLCDILENRDVTVIKAGSDNSKPNFLGIDLVGYQADTIVCSDAFEREVGGSQKLVAIARQAKLSKVIIISEDVSVNGFEVKSELGGALRRVSISDFTDQYSLELIFNMCCPDISFSAGDMKTYELLSLAKRVANTDVTVFINGPTGSGKEVLANYLHENSNRKGNPFVAVNCAAIPENMLEAILFGHEKGAFTGAYTSAPGKFEQANGGTILLDEISEMDLGLQAKLLRVLQEREVERVGGRKTIPLDVRVLATTNRDLKEYVKEGKFREDLYYRLSVFPMMWKPLRERPLDIWPLAQRLLEEHANKMKRAPMAFAQGVQSYLTQYSWPGNVRELDNAIQRSLILATNGLVKVSDFCLDDANAADWILEKPTDVQPIEADSVINVELESDAMSGLGKDLKLREYQIIIDTLKQENGKKKN